jgi:hypothetical protein
VRGIACIIHTVCNLLSVLPGGIETGAFGLLSKTLAARDTNVVPDVLYMHDSAFISGEHHLPGGPDRPCGQLARGG